MKVDKNLIGAAGEHLVLSRLLKRGLLAALTPTGTEKADVLVHQLDGGRPRLIQVKSTDATRGPIAWKMKEEHLSERSSDLIYCFVDFRSKPDRVFVVPSKKVADVLSGVHKAYMRKPKRDGSMRTTHWLTIKPSYYLETKIAPDGWMDKYLENWQLFNK